MQIKNLIEALRGNTVFRNALLVVAGYWSLAWLVPNKILIAVLNMTLIAVCVMVLFVYAPYALQLWKHTKLDKVQQLTLGIVVSWLGLLLARSWVVTIWTFDQLAWMRSSAFIGFYVFLAIIAGVLHITAPRSEDEPMISWTLSQRIGITVLFGGVAATILYFLGIQPGR